MKVKIESSTLVKPSYEGTPPPTNLQVPLSVFDTVTFDTHIAVIYAYRPPSPPNSTVEKGLAVALSEYREWAGRLVRDDTGGAGKPVILLNDEGVRFVEASVDLTLDRAMMPFRPSAELLSLHPSLHGVEELVQVQLTRFACGSMVVGFTSHHMVADGHSTSRFLVAWGRAVRGLGVGPLPALGRSSFFAPRHPPSVEFEHRGVEFTTPKKKKLVLPAATALGEVEEYVSLEEDDVVVHKAHFTRDFLARLKARASAGAAAAGARPYSTFESLLAHLWRLTSRARGLRGHETSKIRISVNGRARMRNPRVPDEYFGNLVLWAFPTAKVRDLLNMPLRHAAGLIHDAVATVDDRYFRSYIDFASSGAVKEEELVPTAEMGGAVTALCPDLEVDSWLRFPFYDLDLGGGEPFVFMPTYFPVEGMLFLLPSFIGDGSIDAFVPLFRRNLPTFKKICYSLDEDV